MSLRTTNKPICLLNSIWISPTTATTTTPFWTSRGFSKTSIWCSGKNKQQKTDPRVTMIRYHLQHPLMPRPLRLSRGRALRHWTIAQAWNIWEKKKKLRVNLELQRQYQSIQLAMEVLRNLDDGTNGNEKIGSRLFRIALEKKGVYKTGSIPIEYSRLQTETPGAVPWDHNWKR